jgi:DNA-binding NtrC family response regulator
MSVRRSVPTTRRALTLTPAVAERLREATLESAVSVPRTLIPKTWRSPVHENDVVRAARIRPVLDEIAFDDARSVVEELARQQPVRGRKSPYQLGLETCSRAMAERALHRARGNKAAAARALGISRQALHGILKRKR